MLPCLERLRGQSLKKAGEPCDQYCDCVVSYSWSVHDIIYEAKLKLLNWTCRFSNRVGITVELQWKGVSLEYKDYNVCLKILLGTECRNLALSYTAPYILTFETWSYPVSQAVGGTFDTVSSSLTARKTDVWHLPVLRLRFFNPSDFLRFQCQESEHQWGLVVHTMNLAA